MNNSNTRMDTILRWAARVWSLPAIVFILGEVIFPHGGDAPVSGTEWLSLGLMITAVIGLAIAWRWETFGGTLSILTMLSTIIVLSIEQQAFFWEPLLVWVGFIIAPAALFLVNGLRARPSDLNQV